LAATAVNQPKSSSLDATLVNEDSAPPLEKLVDVGGFRLHINCTGAGSPTVVLDAGLGVPSPTWSLVQPQVAKFTRVCSYDRAGIGKSDPGSIPRTSQQIATELHSLLNNAGIKGPYVMVGHSFGGLNVRLYTSQFPNEVVGMVLVDSSHEEQPPVDLAYDAKSLRWINFCRSLAQSQIKASTKYPQGAYSQQQAALYRDCSGSNGELAAFKESQAQARATQDSFGDMPLVVLTHGLPPSSWWSAHEELARRSSKGTHIVAERSGHFIQKDQPDLVSDAIYKVVEAARQK
jgi:pimeloyl-ACP methyl ester carboxylesterase